MQLMLLEFRHSDCKALTFWNLPQKSTERGWALSTAGSKATDEANTTHFGKTGTISTSKVVDNNKHNASTDLSFIMSEEQKVSTYQQSEGRRWNRRFGLLLPGPSCHKHPNLPGPQIAAGLTNDAAHAASFQVDRKPHIACRYTSYASYFDDLLARDVAALGISGNM